MNMIMQSVESQLIANLLSTGVMITIFWFLAKKYLGTLEARLNKSEDNAKKLEQKAYDLEHNYIDRFEGVNKKAEETKDYLSRKLDDLQTDKVNFRMKQIEKMATIENKVDNLRDQIERSNHSNHK
jgi:F0F1-type ATP synthase membrane subunit b/b'